ncbi:SCO1664 family protein [Ornithinimicrobium sp. LYQ121]|uniref:SCO1664 family protein n=1 Tax=Ornithinimicrobium sp. LYQ121 TaxID=3378801 RepID=UPI003852B2AA
MAGTAHPDLGDDEALALLRDSTIEPLGVLTRASNLTLLAELHDGSGTATGHRAVYKPVRGERPLADFPHGTLAAREVAAYLVSREGGWDLVPPTVLRDGPIGPGSLQWWVEQEPERLADPSGGLVEVLRPEELDESWLGVVEGQDEDGQAVVVAHADDARLRSMAVLDVALNNADRKAAHLTLDSAERLRGFDHGLCLHEHDKLRTVLWGWAGRPVPDEDLTRLVRLSTALDGTLRETLLELLDDAEVEALRGRVGGLRRTAVMPVPAPGRYPLPWPLW